MTLAAPACEAPWTALIPIPPMPMTITCARLHPSGVDRGTPARAHAAAEQADLVQRQVSSTFTAESAETVVVSTKVEMPHIWPTGVSVPASLSRKSVGSSHREPASSPAPRSQRFCWPEAHQRQWPQEGRNEKTTWSPSLIPLWFGGAAVTMPAPSWPPANG